MGNASESVLKPLSITLLTLKPPQVEQIEVEPASQEDIEVEPAVNGEEALANVQGDNLSIQIKSRSSGWRGRFTVSAMAAPSWRLSATTVTRAHLHTGAAVPPRRPEPASPADVVGRVGEVPGARGAEMLLIARWVVDSGGEPR